MSRAWDGLLAIDKAAGPTSHDVVARVRAATGCARVGHAGTLDPPATGLLLLLLGCATRLARFLPDDPKVYEGDLVLGRTTTTDDVSGDVIRLHHGAIPGPRAVAAAARGLCGVRLQVPPAYSARHVEGTRLYRLARRGVAVNAPATSVRIDALDLLPTDDSALWRYRTSVSAGTYVRAIVRDLGVALGCGAVVASLRRTAIGSISVEDAFPAPSNQDALRREAEARLVPIDAMRLSLPGLVLHDSGDVESFSAGTPFPCREPSDGAAYVAVRDAHGVLLGVGSIDGAKIRPRVVLPRPAALPGRRAV